MACPISLDNIFNCANVSAKGILPEAILINYADFAAATVTVDVTTKQIENIVLPQGKKGYLFSFPKSSTVQPSVGVRSVDRGIDTFEHSIDMVVQQISQTYREDLSKLRFTPVVVIIARKDGVYELYGRNIGMKISAIVYEAGNADTSGTMQLTLTTPSEEPGEMQLPIEIFDTNPATTKAVIDSLLIVAP